MPVRRETSENGGDVGLRNFRSSTGELTDDQPFGSSSTASSVVIPDSNPTEVIHRNIELEDPFIDRNGDNLISLPSFDGSDLPQLPPHLSMKLPTPSIASRTSKAPESEGFILDFTPSDKEDEAKHKQPKQSKQMVADPQDDGVEDWEASTQTSVFVPDDNSSDADYEPPKTKKQAKKSSSGPRSKVNNATTRKPSPVGKPPAKAPVVKNGPRKTKADSRPNVATTHQKPRANDKEEASTAENLRDIKKNGNDSMVGTSTTGAQSPSRASTRKKPAQELPKPAAKRVAKKPFYPVSAPQQSQLNAEAADDAFELTASSPELPTKNKLPRSKPSKTGDSPEITQKKGLLPEKGSPARASTKKAAEVEPSKTSQNKVSETIASVGPNSKKKRKPVKYGLQSKSSKRSINPLVVEDVDAGLNKGKSIEKRHVEREFLEEKEPSQEPTPAKLDEPSINENDEKADPHIGDDNDSPTPMIEDTELPDEPMLDSSAIGDDTNVCIEISSDRGSEITHTEEPIPAHDLESETVAGPNLTLNYPPVSAPIDTQQPESMTAKDILGMIDDDNQIVPPRDDHENHQDPVVAAEHPVDQIQRKRKITENEPGDSNKCAKSVASSSDPLPHQVIVRHKNTLDKPASPEPQHTRPAVSPRGDDALRIVSDARDRIEPRVVAAEQPIFNHRSDEKRRGLFTIYEDGPDEVRNPSSGFEEDLSGGRGVIDISFPKIADSRATSSLIRDLGSPIRGQARRENLAPAPQRNASAIRTPLKDIRHIPINGYAAVQAAGASSVDRTTTLQSLSTNDFRPRDRREKMTGADRLSGTLYNVVDNIMGHLEMKQTAVENVVPEYTYNTRNAISKLKEVHRGELEGIVRHYDEDRLSLVRDYERLSNNIKSFRDANASKNEIQTYKNWRLNHNQRLHEAKNKLLKD